MSVGTEILRELFISLGWKYDDSSGKKVVAAEKKTTAELEAESKKREAFAKKTRESLEQTAKTFLKVTATIEATALGVTAVIERMARSFERAYYASSRTGSSVKELNAFGFAASQVGSSAEEAQSAVEGLAKAQREMPGFGQMLKGLGATNPNDIVKSLTEIMPRLAAMPYNQAEAYAKVLGIPEHLLLAMHDHLEEFKKFQAESNAKYGALGFDPEKAAKDGKDLTQLFRTLYDTVDKVTQLIGSKLFKDLKGPIADLNTYLLAHGKDMSDVIVKIADALVKIATTIANSLSKVDWSGVSSQLDKLTAGFGAMLDKLGGKGGLEDVLGGVLDKLGQLALSHLPPWLKFFIDPAGLGNDLRHQFNDAVGATVHPHDDPMALAPGPYANADGSIRGHLAAAWRNRPRWLGGGGSERDRHPRPGRLSGSQSANADAVKDEMRKAGYNDNAIAAVLGSMQTESSFNPRAHNDVAGGHTGAWQWDSARWPKVAAWIKSQGGDPYDYRWQAKAWIAEHNAKPGDPIYDNSKTEAGGVILRSNPTLEQAVHGVRLSERFGAGEEGGRAANASNWLPRIQAPPPGQAGDADWLAHRGGKVPIPPIITNPFGGFDAAKLRSTLGAAPPLGGAPADQSKNVTINQTNHNNVTGVSDPTAAAGQIGARQNRHSSLLVRSMQSAIG